MIRHITTATCDFCGKEDDDILNLKKIAIFDSSVVQMPKASLDICTDCFAKMVESLRSPQSPRLKEWLTEKFPELNRRVGLDEPHPQ